MPSPCFHIANTGLVCARVARSSASRSGFGTSKGSLVRTQVGALPRGRRNCPEQTTPAPLAAVRVREEMVDDVEPRRIITHEDAELPP